ncbi:MAG: DUF2780 domain-containing protein [Planctomycetota bacterium]
MEIAEYLASRLGVSTRRAEGGAGLLLQLAEQRLPREAFVRLADSVPAISDVIGKAPQLAQKPVGAARQTMSRWLGGLGGLLPVVEGFAKLGCDRTTVRRFAEELAEFFREQAGDDVAKLFRDALR